MEKLIIAFCTWKRHDLTDIVIEYYKKMQEIYGFKIVVCDSENRSWDGVEVLQYENYPVAQKHAALFTHCKQYNPDGIILIGSDDLLSNSQLEWYKNNAKKGTKSVIEFSKMWFYSTKTKSLSFLDNPNIGYGAGRYFSNAVLKKCDYNPWGESKESKGLDNASKANLLKLGIEVKKVESDGMILDIKHTDNLTNEAIVDAGIKVEISDNYMEGLFGDTWAKIKSLERPQRKEVVIVGESATIVTTGKNKYYPNGTELKVDTNTAKVLISKGFAYLKQ
jgi:hypothetical protein